MSERVREHGDRFWSESDVREIVRDEIARANSEPPVEPYNPPYVFTQERFEEFFGVELEDWRWKLVEYYTVNNGAGRPDGSCPHFRESWQTDALWAAHISNCEG